MKEKRSSALRVVLGLVAGFCLGLVLVACGTSNDNSTANSNASSSGNTSSNTKPTAPAPTGSTSPATTTASTSGGTTGVPVCDEYIEKYEKCLNDKVPEAARAQLRTSLETTRKAWKDAAATPQGKAGLAQGCQAALNTAKQSMSAYGCTW
jgi:ABC-type phosphate transport system substrate-binding protein